MLWGNTLMKKIKNKNISKKSALRINKGYASEYFEK